MRCLSLLRQDGDAAKYIKEIHRFPLLSREEEFTLAKDWASNKNKASMEKLVKGHLRLVVQIAKGYSGYGISINELIAEGNIGILQAINHYDPELGFRLSTYSAWWIKARMQDYIFNTKSLVKLGAGKAHRKLFFCLNKIKKALGIDKVSEENVERISEQMNIKKELIIDADSRLSSTDFSINAKVGSDENASTWEEFIVDEEAGIEEAALERQEMEYRKKIFNDGLALLSERDQKIIYLYRLADEPLTLGEIGKIFGISKERVRQLDERAMAQLREYIASKTNVKY